MTGSESFQILTRRLCLSPVSEDDFEDLAQFKADPKSFSHMLGGVRTRHQTQEELEKDLIFWKQNKVGIFSIRLRSQSGEGRSGAFVGITGLHQRQDWSGFALRFAILPVFRGQGLGKEAVSENLNFLFRSGLSSVWALAREDNIASRRILSGIGMQPRGIFIRQQIPMWIYEAKAPILPPSFKKAGG